MTGANVGNDPLFAPGSGPDVFPVEDIHWAEAWGAWLQAGATGPYGCASQTMVRKQFASRRQGQS
jgi:hypothetical protein